MANLALKKKIGGSQGMRGGRGNRVYSTALLVNSIKWERLETELWPDEECVMELVYQKKKEQAE